MLPDFVSTRLPIKKSLLIPDSLLSPYVVLERQPVLFDNAHETNTLSSSSSFSDRQLSAIEITFGFEQDAYTMALGLPECALLKLNVRVHLLTTL